MSEEIVTATQEIEQNGDGGNKKEKSKLREVIEFCIPIVVAVAIALCLRTFVFANAVVPTGSMLNTIQEAVLLMLITTLSVTI